MWQQLTTDKMDDYSYQKKVTLIRNEHLSVTTFKGNSKIPYDRDLAKGDAFAFREVFHDEHIIPIKIIIKQLLELDVPTEENIVKILSKISICRMLKTEDRSIYNSHNRSSDVGKIIETNYLKSGVYVKDYPYTHINLMTEAELSTLEVIKLVIPKDTIIEFFPHPESYGYKMALFANGMYTDVYEDGNGDYYSTTNDLDLINYMMILQQVFTKKI